jgi:hypothetical protein
MALRKIPDQEMPSNQCTRYTRCAAWDSCPEFVCSEEVADDEVLSGFLRESWSKNLMTCLSFFKVTGQILPRTLNDQASGPIEKHAIFMLLIFFSFLW